MEEERMVVVLVCLSVLCHWGSALAPAQVAGVTPNRARSTKLERTSITHHLGSSSHSAQSGRPSLSYDDSSS